VKFASLGSGSKGNATLIQQGETLLMIDNGFSVKEAEKRLNRLNVKPGDISAILVTHEHADHMSGVTRFASRFETAVWASHGTASMIKGDISSLYRFNSHQDFMVDDIKVTPVLVPHDAKEPTQFVFKTAGCQFGLMTDVGSITAHMVEALSGCDALLLECNYDLDMLMNGAYPASLKRRVSGDWGHLDNQQSASLLKQLDTKNLQHLVLAHVSEKNNTHERVLDVISHALGCDRAWLEVIDQEKGLDWKTILASKNMSENIHA
jgi:phosphoribosyl 1,2-cyclic phosphodiesterase